MLKVVAVRTAPAKHHRMNICDALAGWVVTLPQLKILNAVIVPHAVLVVNVFRMQKRPPKVLRHHCTMV